MRTAMRQMRGVFHELDRRLIAKRLRDGRNAKAAKGGHATGSPPYGWQVDKPNADNPRGALVPQTAEQAALARMAGVRWLSVPSSSSSPHRPQLLHVSK